MTTFKIGDRVKAYGGVPHTEVYMNGAAGTIVNLIHGTEYAVVEFDRDYTWEMNTKQLRRLKPKAPPREVWLEEYQSGLSRHFAYDNPEDASHYGICKNPMEFIGVVRFVEAKRK